MINPIAFHIGPFSVHWYGIAYVAGLLVAILILIRLNRKRKVFENSEQIYDLTFWIFLLGVIVCGRLGYVLFYNPVYYLQHPTEIMMVWKGGMSFHGGLIGSIVVGYTYFKKHKIDVWRAADLMVVPVPLALMFGRLANFVNRELVGRVIENKTWQWLGVDFGDGLIRYPSQLFAAGKDLLLFTILLFLFSGKPRPGTLIASFLMLYGTLRFLVGFFREPDAQIGFLFHYLTLGQLFSFLMIVAGMIVFWCLKIRSPK